MPHLDRDGPLSKRQRHHAPVTSPPASKRGSSIFAPFRTIGLISPTEVPFASVPLGKKTFQITTSVGRALQTYDLRRGLNLIFVTRPQTPANISAICARGQQMFAAWGDRSRGDGAQGFWVFQRGRKVAELELPADLDQPIQQILIFGSWIVGVAATRIEVWRTNTLELWTTLFVTGCKGENEITGGVRNMPTFLNKIFVGRKNGWVEVFNVSTGKLVYTIVAPAPDFGAVECLEPTPALSLLAIAYSKGPMTIHDVLTDKVKLIVKAGTENAPVSSISFRSDGLGAGEDGRKDGLMATASHAHGDVTFWDLNKGGRIMGVLRSAHNPPSDMGDGLVRGGISKVEFLDGQPVIMTSGRDNSLKSWIFDDAPFSPVPRILHSRSGHSGPVTCLHFLPSDFDGAEAGDKWLISGGQDRSLWGWSLRRDGQSTEISQGNIRKKAKKIGLFGSTALTGGPTTILDDLKAPEITCIASSLNRDGGIGALPGKLLVWQKGQVRSKPSDTAISGMTGWESIVTAHKDDPWARTWFWGRKRAGRWAFRTRDESNVSTIAMSPCGTFALVGSVKGGIDMFNLQSGQKRQSFPSTLAPAQLRQMKMQQLKTEADPVEHLQKRCHKQFAPSTGRHTEAVTGIVVDAMNRFVTSCSLDGKIKFWDFLTGCLVDEIDWAPTMSITGCRCHAGNDLLAFSCDDHSIRVVDMETKKSIREFHGCRGEINDFCFSNDGRWIVAASEDCTIRVWDLATSHLIDGFRLENPCTALAFSATGEYLAGSVRDELGVQIWTNKSLFRHVPTRQISEAVIEEMAGPTVSGEGGQGLLEAAFEGTIEDEGDDDTGVPPSVEQLSGEMMTLSLVPKARWQTLLHLDLIKQRNKPKEAPKAPEKAPFFLPGMSSLARPDLLAGATCVASSRILQFERTTRAEEAFSAKLRLGAETGDYTPFIEHLKSLPPSTADLEIRSLSASDPSSAHQTNELLHFLRALTARLAARRDYELIQAWMTVFLRLHHDQLGGEGASEEVRDALREWRKRAVNERERLHNLIGYCGGVVAFLRNPRT